VLYCRKTSGIAESDVAIHALCPDDGSSSTSVSEPLAPSPVTESSVLQSEWMSFIGCLSISVLSCEMRPSWIVEIAMFYKRYEHNYLGFNDLATRYYSENTGSV
jgi:hypothetical protein